MYNQKIGHCQLCISLSFFKKKYHKYIALNTQTAKQENHFISNLVDVSIYSELAGWVTTPSEVRYEPESLSSTQLCIAWCYLLVKRLSSRCRTRF